MQCQKQGTSTFHSPPCILRQYHFNVFYLLLAPFQINLKCKKNSAKHVLGLS